MWAAIKRFLAANALKAASIGLTGLTIAAVLVGARNAGKVAERAETLARQAKQIRRAHEIEDENRRLGDGVAAERLLSDWSRD